MMPNDTHIPIERPRCINCHTVMRHSCTEDLAPGSEWRVYECVACGSTQTQTIIVEPAD